MLSPAIARELRERGHDVLAVAEHPGWAALSDPEILAVARTERKAKLTEYPGDEDLENGECWL
jgi:hypothetical protein